MSKKSKCYHSDYDFKVLNGPFIEAHSVNFPPGRINIDLRDVMYLRPSTSKGSYPCGHKWEHTKIEFLLRYINQSVTIKLNSDKFKAFQAHWQKWHNSNS